MSKFSKEAKFQKELYWSDPRREQKEPTSERQFTGHQPDLLEVHSVNQDDSDDRCDVLEEILNLNTDSGRSGQDGVKQKPAECSIKDDPSESAAPVKSADSKKQAVQSGNPAVFGAGSHVNMQEQEEELDFLLALDTPVRHSTQDSDGSGE